MLLLKEMERELQRLNVEEACGRQGCRRGRHQARGKEDSGPPDLCPQRNSRDRGSGRVLVGALSLPHSLLECPNVPLVTVGRKFFLQRTCKNYL